MSIARVGNRGETAHTLKLLRVRLLFLVIDPLVVGDLRVDAGGILDRGGCQYAFHPRVWMISLNHLWDSSSSAPRILSSTCRRILVRLGPLPCGIGLCGYLRSLLEPA